MLPGDLAIWRSGAAGLLLVRQIAEQIFPSR